MTHPTIRKHFTEDAPFNYVNPNLKSADLRWTARYVGGGSIVLDSSGRVKIDPAAGVHAAGLQGDTGEITYQDLDFTVNVVTNTQTGTAGFFQVAWIMYRYVDDTHFYYVIQKKGVGMELGMYDGGVNPTDQQFLATESTVPMTLGVENLWRVRCQGDHHQVFVNGVKVLDYTDSAARTPPGVNGANGYPATFNQGKMFLYAESSSVRFRELVVTQL